MTPGVKRDLFFGFSTSYCWNFLRVTSKYDRCIRRARRFASAMDPPAAERAVKVDQVRPACHTCADQRLRRVRIRLRRQHRQVAVDAVLVAQVRQVKATLLRVLVAFERRDLLVVRAARGKAVRHCAECRLDRLP